MDTNWCLTCSRRIDGTEPYCSTDCLNFDRPAELPPPTFAVPALSEDDYDDGPDDYTPWAGRGLDGIRAWANQIPAGAPAGAEDRCTPPPSPPLSAFRPPKLMLPHHHRMPPTLCMSTPQPARPAPSLPIVTPQQHIATLSLSHSAEHGSAGKTSLFTESSLATPASTAPVPIASPNHTTSVLGHFATQVRSWVSPSPSQHRPPRSNNFTVLAKTHNRPSALQVASSSRSSLDDDLSDNASAVWWVSSTDALSTHKKQALPRTRRLPIPRDDHPAYSVRGRKASRAIA